MAKRGYKLQEFVAHSSSVNCLRIGKKACRLFITGGDDHKVNLWTIGKPSSLMSLCGHISPVQSVAFDSAEVLVLGGASGGMVKLWDLEEAKMVRTLTGHRSNCTAVEFHPFGEFFASGSVDANLKIWDIRKKGSIHTYKGHSQGISTIKFTPDGRWVVSGGCDNVVKVWDLTAGKLLHDFKFHEGDIRSIDFHPLEFLLATGSADRTVKFWDLETFELIGTTRREAAGVRSVAFHPDGRTLFAALDDSLKVYSWEPVICHDAVDMGWTTLSDLCIHEGKLLGCSYFRNSVGIWAADISLIEPYGADLNPKEKEVTELKYNLQGSQPEKLGIGTKSPGLCSMSLDDEMKDIKNIYVDSSGERPVASEKSGSLNSLKGDVAVQPKGICDLSRVTHGIAKIAKPNEHSIKKSLVVPSIVPRNITDGKDAPKFENETISFSRTKPGMLLKPAHVRRPSAGKYDERLANSGTLGNTASIFDNSVDPKFRTRLGHEEGAKESCEDKESSMENVMHKFEKILSPRAPSKQEKYGDSPSSDDVRSVKYVNGVAVVRGRTRSLVERFERGEKVQNAEDQSIVSPTLAPETDKPSTILIKTDESSAAIPETDKSSAAVPETDKSSAVAPQTNKTATVLKSEPVVSRRDSSSANEGDITDGLMQNHDVFLSTIKSRLTKFQVVRHFWERNDVKGAISALRKLPDQSVQADVISILMEKMEILTLDLFSLLLPVLTGLLDSKMERHITLSMEMLLKLVAVFGSVIRSTISAPPAVGVDLHAEQRRECCNQCFMHLQKIQKMLPILMRRGGLIVKGAHELSLVLQES